MKKVLKFIISVLLILPVANVYAAGNITVSNSSITIEPGKTQNITIKATNAAGRIDISSSNSSIIKPSISSSWIENETITLSITAFKEGSAKITINITDAATFDGEELTGSKTVNVTVKKKVASQSDATLSSINVEGYQIGFSRNTYTYELEVPNNVSSLKVSAIPSSSAAQVNITGSDDLKVGINKIKIVVMAGDLTTKEYVINVNRKNDIIETTQDKLSSVIMDTTNETIMLMVRKDTVIKDSTISEANKYRKNLIIHKYDEDNNLVYSWTLNKEELKDLSNFDMGISFDSDEIDTLKQNTNYSEGLYVSFNEQGKKVGKIKINMESLYKDDTKVNIYSYAQNELKLIQKESIIKDSSVEFNLGDANSYIITRAIIEKKENNEKKNNNKLPVVVAIIETVVIGGLSIFILLKFYSKKD